MSITVATSKLVDLLSDALHTASPVHGGVYLSCHRAPYLEEPGDVDLLAATSTTGYVVGHSWIPVDGHLTAAVWPVGNTATALGVLKRLSKKADNHTVDIHMVEADPPENLKEGDHPGWIVSISESAALFDSDTVHQFHVHHESKFPVAGVARTLAGMVRAAEGDEYVETPLTVWSAGVLGALVKVAKSNGGSIRMFRSAKSRLQVAQIGLTWLGAAYPDRPREGVDTDGPSIEPVLTVPDEERARLKEMLRNGAGVVTREDLQPTLDEIVEDAVAKFSDA